jgi:hypothetical protein
MAAHAISGGAEPITTRKAAFALIFAQTRGRFSLCTASVAPLFSAPRNFASCNQPVPRHVHDA